MKVIKIGLVSHLVNEENLGCSALAISNIKILDELLLEKGVQPHYVVLLGDPKGDFDIERYISLDGVSDNPYTYKTYPRLKPIIKKPSRLKKADAFNECDVIFDLCGGDGYSDIYGFIKLLAQSVPVYGASYKKKRVIFAPQTIGPFDTVWGKFIAKYILNKLEWIFARDVTSYDCCRRLNFFGKTTQVIDVAFALPYEKREFTGNKFKIGLNISGLLYNGGFKGDNYFNLSFSYKEFVNRLIEEIITNDNCEIHLIGHVNKEIADVDDDYSACEQLHSKYKQCKIAPKFTSPIDAKGYIAGMDLFSGARMHATIAAFSSGVPVIPVAYSRKFNGLYKTLNYPYLIDAKSGIDCDTALNMFQKYIQDIDSMKENIESSKTIYQRELTIYKNKLVDLLGL